MKRMGRPRTGRIKIGVTMPFEVYQQAHEAAKLTCRTVSGFFEHAARMEIARVNKDTK